MTWKLRHLTKVRHLNFASGVGRECWTNFNGINERISMGRVDQTLNFTRTTPFSGCAWIYITNHNNMNVISRYRGVFPFEGWNLTISATGLTQMRLSFALVNNPGNRVVISSIANVPLNQWVHVGWIYDGDVSGTGTKIFFDGVPTPSFIPFSGLTLPITNPLNFFTIGGNDPGVFGNFDGRISNAALFLGALSDANMLDIFNRGRLNPNYNDIPGAYFHLHMDRLNPPDELSNNDGVGINMDLTNITCLV